MQDGQNTPNEYREKVIVTIDGRDEILDFERLGINFDSTEPEILNAVDGILKEMSESISDEGDYVYTVRKATNSQNIYVYPKPFAG